MKFLPRAILASLLLVGQFGCRAHEVAVNGVRMPVDDAARAELEAARAKDAAGDHERAAQMYETVARRYADTDAADEALFGAGRAWEAASQPVRARAAYEQLVEQYPDSDKFHQAEARIDAIGGRQGEAFTAAQDRFEQLPPAGRFDAAVKLAQDAEAGGNGREAFHWRVQAVQAAQQPQQRTQADADLAKLLASLPLSDLQDLVSQFQGSFAEPILRYQIVRTYQADRDWDNLEDALHDFLDHHPQDPKAAEARELLGKVERRGQVDVAKVGIVLPLSGQYKAYGQQLKSGIELALRDSHIQLVFRDDKGEPTDAGAAVEALLYEDHVMAIIGGVLTNEAQAAAAKSDELGVPFVGFGRNEDFSGKSDWVFRDMVTNEEMVDAIVGFAVDTRGLKNFAVLHPDMPYGTEMRDLFLERVEAKGGKMSGVEAYPAGATTFSDPIKKLVSHYKIEDRGAYDRKLQDLKAKAKNAHDRRVAMEKMRGSLTPVIGFDALFIPDQWKTVALVAPALAFEDVITNWCDTKDLDRIARTTKKTLKPVMLLGTNPWNHPDLPARGGKYVNCSVFVDGFYAGSTRPETTRFVQSYNQVYGKAPGLLEAYGYEAAAVVRSVIEQGRPDTRKAFVEGMAGVKNLNGPMGQVTVNEGHEVVHPLYFLTIDNGTIREADATRTTGAL